MKNFLKLGLLSLSVAIALSGCDDSAINGSNSSSNSNSSTNANANGDSQLIEGRLIDGYIAGAHYKCSGELEGDTDINGTFKCKELPVSFSIGGVKLGQIEELPQDKHIFPQDLVGVDRNKTDDKKVLAMAQFLQSLDEDGNPDDGIEIPKEVKEALKDKTLDLTTDEEIQEDINKTLQEVSKELKSKFKKEIKIVDKQKAKEHLKKSKELHEVTKKLPEDIKKQMQTPAKEVPSELKAALAKIEANKEISNELYSYLNSALGENGKQFKELRVQNEKFKFDAMSALTLKYSISKDDIAKFKEALKEDLEVKKAEGENSLEEALKVGCKVESKKIDDIQKAINLAKEAKSADILKTLHYQNEYNFKNYKKFNKELINSGVESGCCSLGEEFCKVDDSKEQKEHKEEKGQKGQEEGNKTKNPKMDKENKEKKKFDGKKEHQEEGKKSEDNSTKKPDVNSGNNKENNETQNSKGGAKGDINLDKDNKNSKTEDKKSANNQQERNEGTADSNTSSQKGEDKKSLKTEDEREQKENNSTSNMKK